MGAIEKTAATTDPPKTSEAPPASSQQDVVHRKKSEDRFLPAFSPLRNPTRAADKPRLIERVTRVDGELVIPYAKYKLRNGLTVIIHEDHSNPRVHVDVTYKVGSKNEVLGLTGVAHLFEHLVYQDSKHVPPNALDDLISSVGGTSNATTKQDYTHYYETFPKHVLEQVLWMEADRMGFTLAALTEEKFAAQLAAVSNERLENYEGKPYGRALLLVNQPLYPPGHPYSWLPIGEREDVANLQLTDARDFFLRWYHPNNAILTIAGDVDEEQTLAWVQKYFGPLVPGRQAPPTTPPPVILTEDRKVSYEDPNISTELIRLTYPTVPRYHTDEAPLDILRVFLASGKNSLLHKNLAVAEITQEYALAHSNQDLAGKFEFVAKPTEDTTLSDIKAKFDEALKEFERTGITQTDIDRLRPDNKKLSALVPRKNSRPRHRPCGIRTSIGNTKFCGRGFAPV